MKRFVRSVGLGLLVAAVACGPVEESRVQATGDPDKGVTTTTRAGGSEVFIEAFDFAGLVGRKVAHVEPIRWTAISGASNPDSHQSARSVEAEARRRGMDFVLSLAVVRGPNKDDLMLPSGFAGAATFADPQVRAAYLSEVEWFVRNLRPTELSLAVELESYGLAQPDDYRNFATLAADAYALVKSISPGTQVMVYWQVEEIIRRFPGGEDGVVDNLTDLVEPFLPNLDLVGLSSYPGLVRFAYPDVASLPADYYSRLEAAADLPFFFAELGYASRTSAIFFPTSEELQAAFVRRFFELVGPMDVDAKIWSFLHDPDLTSSGLNSAEQTFFGSSGLRRRDGTAKPAWDAWLAGG